MVRIIIVALQLPLFVVRTSVFHSVSIFLITSPSMQSPLSITPNEFNIPLGFRVNVYPPPLGSSSFLYH